VVHAEGHAGSEPSVIATDPFLEDAFQTTAFEMTVTIIDGRT
jgi:hypothetical protein